MSLWDRLLETPEEEEAAAYEGEPAAQDDWDEVVYTRQDLNIDDPADRREYVQNCLQQMLEGEREIESLQFEYREVTAYLHDMEEVDGLPPEDRRRVNLYATRIRESEREQNNFLNRKSIMSDEEYEWMERLEIEAEDAIEKMEKAEEYQTKIQNDLKRLDAEQDSYLFRKEQLEKSISNTKSLSIICAVGLAVILILLLLLQAVWQLNVIYGYMAAILIAAVAISVLHVQGVTADKDLRSVKNAVTRMISLQNTVKIRYVNNRNLLDYYALKYGVRKARELEDLWNRFLLEREERAKARETEQYLDQNQQELIRLLRSCRLRYPEIWIHQTEALLSHNEEVEVRHALIVRRQSLRKRMDYNREVVIGNAKAEIEDLAHAYPEYAQEILDQVSRFTEEQGIQ